MSKEVVLKKKEGKNSTITPSQKTFNRLKKRIETLQKECQEHLLKKQMLLHLKEQQEHLPQTQNNQTEVILLL